MFTRAAPPPREPGLASAAMDELAVTAFLSRPWLTPPYADFIKP